MVDVGIDMNTLPTVFMRYGIRSSTAGLMTHQSEIKWYYLSAHSYTLYSCFPTLATFGYEL